MIATVVSLLFPAPAAEGEVAPDDWVTWALLALLAPLAGTWTFLFRESGRNFAENYVFGLYLLAQLVWAELLILSPLSLLLPELALAILYFVAWLALVTWGGVVYYCRQPLEVFWRVLISFVAAGAIAVIATAIIMEFWPVTAAAAP